MATKQPLDLSRRERQIMEVLYRERQATAGEVLERLPDPPGYSAVRALLKILENKGHVRHAVEGNRYVYQPRLPRERAGRPAMAGVLETFFDGSTEKAVATLLDLSRSELSRGRSGPPVRLDRAGPTGGTLT